MSCEFKSMRVAVATLAVMLAGSAQAAGVPKEVKERRAGCESNYQLAVKISKEILTSRYSLLKFYRLEQMLPSLKSAAGNNAREMLPPLVYSNITVDPQISTGGTSPNPLTQDYWTPTKYAPGGGRPYVEGRGNEKTCAIGIHVVDDNPDFELVAIFKPPYENQPGKSILLGVNVPMAKNWGIDEKVTADVNRMFPQFYAAYKKQYVDMPYYSDIQ